MAIKATTGLVPEWYTPKIEEDADDPASFELTPLKAPQIAGLQGEFSRVTGEISGKGLYEAAKIGITDWKNFNDHEGKPLKFSKSNIDVIPYNILIELGGEVLANSFLTGEDEKNS
jgi:hypothetical protein